MTDGAAASAAPASNPSTPSSGAQGSTQAAAAASKGTSVVPQNTAGRREASRGALDPNATKQGASGDDTDGVPSGDPQTPKVTQEATDPNHIVTVKVRGEERKYDLRDPEQFNYVRLQLQKVEGADKRLQEATMTERKAKQVLQVLMQNPGAALQAMGHNVDDLAKGWIARRLHEQAMTPEQKQLHEAQQKLAQYQQREQDAKTEEEARVKSELENRHRVKWDKDITEALSKTNLPKTAYTVERAAKYILEAKKLGYKDVTAADVMETVLHDYKSDMRQMFGTATVDQIMDMVGGDAFLDKLRQHDIARVRDPQKAEFAQKPNRIPQAPQKRDQRKKGLSWQEYQKVLEQRVRE